MADALPVNSIDPTQRFLIRILADYLNRRPTVPAEDVDWAALQKLAANHSVSGIVFQQCMAFLPAPAAEALSAAYASELFYYQNRAASFQTVSKALSDAGIDFYTVKGLNVAKLYPIPALRTMGDCDIIVHPADKQKAHRVMTELGLVCTKVGSHEWLYYQDELEYEIHDHLLYDDVGVTQAEKDFTETAWAHAEQVEGRRYELDWSFHFVFLLLHLKRHLVNVGVGLRQFMDLWVARQRCTLDEVWIDEALQALGLKAFRDVCFSLIAEWFDGQASMQLTPVREAQTLKILGNGTFGFHDSSNRARRGADTLILQKGARPLARVKALLLSVFPAYREMRCVPQYKFLDGRPWLLPAAWLYRYYRAIRLRMGKNAKRMLSEAFVSGKVVDERAQELAQWGLQ